MTVREIVETLGLAADEDAVRKMAEYNAMVIAMSRKMNLTGNQRCRRKPGQKYL